MTHTFVPGTAVTARGRLWRVGRVTAHPDCVELALDPAASEPAHGRGTVLLHPFDRIGHPPRARPLLVSRRAWWRRVGWRVVTQQALDSLVSPASARVDLLPYQLEPALAVCARGALRLLLADAVGLGKTVQAAIVIAELLARNDATRALVLVPAGLRDQWAGELRARFCLDAEVIDAPAVRAIAGVLPRTVSPWLVPRIAVVSIDYAKRPEVRLGLHDVPWDLVVVDEAHTVTRDSDRYRAVHLLAQRARRVVLITATPHSGDDAAFAALAGLGAACDGDPLTLFRRSRRDVGLDTPRRRCVLRVSLGPAEQEAIRLLVTYVRNVWSASQEYGSSGGRLAAVVLLKRAFSSPASLFRTALRRRRLLKGGAPQPRQLLLPIDDEDPSDEEPWGVLAAPGLADLAEEIDWLDRIVSAARTAAPASRKMAVLERLVRRSPEPLIVFTEYRDTLRELEARLAPVRRCVSLHGGLGRDAREQAVRAFTDGTADVLLTTDAGGCGLNLHHRCRRIVNVELPWSPVRLEQRVGRVDRIGQPRRVHAVHLVARGTPEESLLARLARRTAHARKTLGDAESAWEDDVPDLTTAAAMLGEAPWAGMSGPASAFALRATARPQEAAPHDGSLPAGVTRGDLRGEALAEVERQAGVRRLLSALQRSHRARPVRSVSQDGPVVTFARVRPNQRVRAAPDSPGVLALFAQHTVDHCGRLVDEALVPLWVACRIPRPPSRALARRTAEDLVSALSREPLPSLQSVLDDRQRSIRASLEAAEPHVRARQLAAALRAETTGGPIQTGLFERRGEREAARRRAAGGVTDQPAAHAGARPVEPGRSTASPPRLVALFVVTT